VQEGHQSALPHALDILAHRAPPELPYKHWGRSILLQIGPMLLPDGEQRVRKDSRVGNLEPLLIVDLRAVVMGRIHQFVRPREPHGELFSSFQVPAPPVGVALVHIDPLDEDQPIWIDGQDGVACPLGSQAPISAGIATAPGRWPVWFVGQVSPDDGLIAPVVLGQHDPVLDPARLGRLVVVPQWGPLIGRGIMTVQDDLQANFTSALDNPIHQCQPSQAFEIGVQLVVDPPRLAPRVEELVGERQANGIEACACDLVEHALPVAHSQPVRGESTALKPRPADA
jgi:hypothetical protein